VARKLKHLPPAHLPANRVCPPTSRPGDQKMPGMIACLCVAMTFDSVLSVANEEEEDMRMLEENEDIPMVENFDLDVEKLDDDFVLSLWEDPTKRDEEFDDVTVKPDDGSNVATKTVGLAQAGAIEAVVKPSRTVDEVDMNVYSDTFEITPVTEEETRTWADLLVAESLSGYRKPKPAAVRKIIQMNRLFLHLLVSGIIAVCPDDLLSDEKETGVVSRFLRAGRCFDVINPVMFNSAFRALQSSGHPSWKPRVKADGASTTAVTQPLDAIGIGPVKTSPWKVHKGGVRGPAGTDPRAATGRKRDGLYYFRYIYDPERAKNKCNAKRLFASLD